MRASVSKSLTNSDQSKLRVFDRWRQRIDRQLAHISYIRDDVTTKEIWPRNQRALYNELRNAWRRFRNNKKLPKLYADKFIREIKRRKAPYRSGQLSEFRGYDLD